MAEPEYLEMFKQWMSTTAKTRLPHIEQLYREICSSIRLRAESNHVTISGRLLIDVDALFNHSAITKEQHLLLIRAIHALENYLNKADLSDSDLFTAQSSGMMAIKAMSSSSQ